MSKSGTTILSLHIKDFQGIRAARLDNLPPDGVIVVQGPVGAGKTSVLQSIKAALGGKAHVHERAINDEGGAFTVDLELTNGFRIDRHSTPANPKGTLVVIGPDDGKYGQTALDEFMGPLSFDPLSFISLPLEKQAEIVLSLDSDTERPKRIAKLRAERQALVDERKPLNSEMLKIQQMKSPAGERPQPVDVSATAARLKDLRAMEAAAAVTRQTVITVESNLRNATKRADERFAEVEEARKALARAEQAFLDAKAEEAECKAALDDANAAVLPGPDPNVIAGLEQALDDANNLAAALAPWEEWDRAVRRRGELKSEIAEWDDRIEASRAAEIAEFSAIQMPIQGMAVDSTGAVLWRGRPLELASGGERISIAVAVAFAVNPELKICLLDEANNIGQPQLDALDAAAKERGFQIWACRLEGKGTITVDKGVASK